MKTRLLSLHKASSIGWTLFVTLLLTTTQLWAQQTQIACNKDGSTAFIPPTIPANNLTVATAADAGIGVAYWESGIPCSVTNPLPPCGPNGPDNVKNSSTTDFARAHLTGVATTASLTVTDGISEYSGGNFAGFVIRNPTLVGGDLFAGITIATYNNGNFVQQSTASSLIGLNSSIVPGAYEVGFITTQPFDAIEIRFSGLASAQVYDVFYAVQRSYCAGPTPDCNVKTSLVTSSTASTATGYPAAVNRIGATGVSAFFINNPGNITDSDINNAATISLGVGLGSTAFISVKDQVDEYTNAFAGFEISNNSAVGVKLLSNISITVYNNNTVVQTVSGSSLLAGVSFLNNTRQIIGFIPSGTFDEVQISFTSVATGDASITSIYRAVIERFCTATAPVCKNLTPLTNPTYPVYVNNQRTGIDATLCAGCSITNTENVIDAAATTPATINLLASANSSARFSVANALDTYPAGTFAGFEISSGVLANINVAGSVRITLYNNGTEVQSGAGTTLLAGVAVLSGTASQTVGTVGQVPFDEIQIEFNQLTSANPLGPISIYRAVLQTSCPTTIACNQTIALNTGTTSAVIEGTRTGFSGAATINGLNGSSINNPWNVVSSDPTDFATISNLVDGDATGSISVADPATVYPSGTFAGFTIRKGNFIVSADLLPFVRVTTYLDGVQQETKAGTGNLLDLSVRIGGSSTTAPFNIGFYATKPFDEIRLGVGSLTDAVAQSVDVYGAFVDTRFSSNGGSLVCNFALNPDFNVTTKNVPVSGNVSTNDIVPNAVTYGPPTPAGTNPSGATITLNPDGTYSFTATNAGSYTYTVPVCPTAQTTGCPTTPLIITVLDPTVTTNPPVANPDYASVQSATATPGSVTINVRANDSAGNPGGTLVTPTVTVNPANGTATASNGNIVYTPNAGYTGDDVITYQVCETPGGLCATAQVIVHVTPVGTSTVSVGDDFAKTAPNTPVSGNVLTNDLGTGLTVSNTGTINAPGKGTLVLGSDGVYTFTPTTSVTGPLDFTYTACDNSATPACGTATLHILVTPGPDLTNVVYARPSSAYNTTPLTVVVDVSEVLGQPSSGQIRVLLSKATKASLSFDPNATTVGGRAVQNSSWQVDNSNSSFYILTTNQSVPARGKLSFGFTGTLTPGATSGTLTLTSAIEAGSGGEIRSNNNADADKIDYFQQ